MDVLRYISESGDVEVKFSTASIIGSWKRFQSRIDDITTEENEALTYCDYHTSQSGELWLADFTSLSDNLTKIGDGSEWKNLPPVLYETCTYNVNIYFRGVERPPRVSHKLKEITDLFTAIPIGDNDYILTAPLSFVNEPGEFRLAYTYKPIGKNECNEWLTATVVSPKLDTKRDYKHILYEINREYNDLVFRYLTKTYQNLTLGKPNSNEEIWLSVFREVAKGYIDAVNFIINRPHLKTQHEVRFSRAERVKRWTPMMCERFHEKEHEGVLDETLFRHTEIRNTINTRENRFVKFTLDRIGLRLTTIISHIVARSKDGISDTEKAELNAYLVSLKKAMNNPLFRSLRGEPLHNESMVLQKRTGYAQVYRYWLILQSGVELFEGNSAIGVRPVWELYELWCFLKLRDIIADILQIDKANPEQFHEDRTTMLNPFTDSSLEHKIAFFPANGDVVELLYQHTYNRSSGDVHTATTDNRPDFVLNIIKPDGMTLTYLFDAKYRVQDDSEFSKDDRTERSLLSAADYPPSDTLNQMHRYRDAIYYGSKNGNRYTHTAKEIIGGYILFPGRGNDEAIRNRYFFKSIEEVNIGAFPLLPVHDNPTLAGTLLREHLEKILLSNTAYNLIKDSIPQRGLVYSRTIAESNDLVLVGYFKTEQKEAILRNKLYYVPAGLGKGSINLVSGFENTKYILLHHNDERMLLELVGTGPKFFTRGTLEDMGFTPSGDYYLGFEIKSIKPIEIEDYDIASLDLRERGKQSFRPYFTTLKELFGIK